VENCFSTLLGPVGAKYSKLYPRTLAQASEGLGCLDFLNGKSGRTRLDDEGPAWLGELVDVVVDNHKEQVSLRPSWAEGYMTTIFDGRPKRREKLGKWLRKNGATPEWLHEFETREVDVRWEITTDPAEVLGMSFDRAWTSCMRPGGAYERGPLWDLMAGSALVLFFRPGADKPCGREILRPAVDKDGSPLIVRGGIIYGMGTSVPSENLTDEMPVRFGYDVPHDTLLFGREEDVYLDGGSSLGRWFGKGELPKWESAFLMAFAPFLGQNVPERGRRLSAAAKKKTTKKKTTKKKTTKKKVAKKTAEETRIRQLAHVYMRKLQYRELQAKYGRDLCRWLETCNRNKRSILVEWRRNIPRDILKFKDLL